MAQALLVTAHFTGTVVEAASKSIRLESGLTVNALDWLRFNGYTWFVRTELEPMLMYQLLKPHITVFDSLLIIKIDLSATNRFGQAMNWVWNWLNK